MDVTDKVEHVKKILIPRYFYEIIIPNMEGYYNDYTVDFDIRPVAKCPLHGEDTPSFRWYEDTNTYFCFGCRSGGDIINLHRNFIKILNGTMPSFKDAVTFLNNYFLNGMSEAEILMPEHKDEVIYKSTVAEMLLFSNFIKSLEDRLARDTNISLEMKKKAYSVVDEMQLLTSLNLINAKDAMQYIKHTTNMK